MFAEFAFPIFEQSIIDYHKYDDVNHPIENPYEKGSIEHLLYAKNLIRRTILKISTIIIN